MAAVFRRGPCQAAPRHELGHDPPTSPLLCKVAIMYSGWLCPAKLSPSVLHLCSPPGMQEAMKDAEAAANERAGLVSKLRELQAKLDEEAASRSALKDRAQRKLLAAEQEVRGGFACTSLFSSPSQCAARNACM